MLALQQRHQQERNELFKEASNVFHGQSREDWLQMERRITEKLDEITALSQDTNQTVGNIDTTTASTQDSLSNVGANVKDGFQKTLAAIEKVGNGSLNCSKSVRNMMKCIIQFIQIIFMMMQFCLYLLNSLRPSNVFHRMNIKLVSVALYWFFLLLEFGVFMNYLSLLCIQYDIDPELTTKIIIKAVDLFWDACVQLTHQLTPCANFYMKLYGGLMKTNMVGNATALLQNNAGLFMKTQLSMVKTEIRDVVKTELNNAVADSAETAMNATSALAETAMNATKNLVGTTTDAMVNVMTDGTNRLLDAFNDLLFHGMSLKGGTNKKRGGGNNQLLFKMSLSPSPSLSLSKLLPLLQSCRLLNNIGNLGMYLCMMLVMHPPPSSLPRIGGRIKSKKSKSRKRKRNKSKKSKKRVKVVEK